MLFFHYKLEVAIFKFDSIVLIVLMFFVLDSSLTPRISFILSAVALDYRFYFLSFRCCFVDDLI